MSILPVQQPSFMAKIDNVQEIQNQPMPDLSAKPDSFEMSANNPQINNPKKGNGKAGRILAFGAAVVGIAILARKMKLKNIPQEAQKIQKNSQTFIDSVLRDMQSVEADANGVKTLEDISRNGKKVVIKSTLDADNILTIDNFKKQTRIVAKKGVLKDFYKGFDFAASENGTTKAKEKFMFSNNNLTTWFKELCENADDSGFAKEAIKFRDEKLFQQMKNFKGYSDGTSRIKELKTFEDGKISALERRVSVNPDGSAVAKKAQYFVDGKLFTKKKNVQIPADENMM